MRLADLFAEVQGQAANLPISGVTADSRKVSAGMAFVALPGTRHDGRAFIKAAVEAGAVAVIGEGDRPEELASQGASGDVVYCPVGNVRLALARAAARFYPGAPQTVVAVTGTSGKSSVAEFTRQIFMACGHEAASLGTLGIMRKDQARYGSLTTPDPLSLHHSLADLASDGVTHLAMEASSHGLAQYRLDGVRLSAAAFTNLGHDHLDYHRDLEDYFGAKLRLFTEVLPEGAAAVVHTGSAYAPRVIAACQSRGQRVLTVGGPDDALALRARRVEGFSQRLDLGYQGAEVQVLLPLAGAFQADNALVAAGLALALGEKPERVFAALDTLTGVRGRLERVASPAGTLIVVDYAHKPDGLRAVLETLRPVCTGRLICLFGCGGDRDRAKRPEMGRIASELADCVIVTDDNPRSEDPAAIRQAILASAPEALEIGDRQTAINHAVAQLGPGNVLVVAGKGHETGQIIGDQVRPFSDHDAIADAVALLAQDHKA